MDHGEPRTARMSGQDIVLLYTTFPTTTSAEQVGRSLVEARLAACVNILPGMVSWYEWQGRLERGEEAVMIVKTRRSLADSAMDAIRAGRPCEEPSLLVLPVAGGSPTYCGWILAQTEAAPAEA